MKQLFIGLNVFGKSWSVIIQEGQVVLKRFSLEADADAPIHYIQKHYPAYPILIVVTRVAVWVTTCTAT